MNQIHTALLSAPEIFGQAWRFYINHFGRLTGIVAIPAVFSVVLFFVATLLGIGDPQVSVEDSMGISVVLIFIIAAIVNVALSIWGQVALLIALRDETVSITGAYGQARTFFASYVWVSILTGLAVLLGLILLIIPGIIVMILFGFASYIVVMENIKGTQALKKSREYVRGRWWGVFGRIFFMLVFATLVVLAISVITWLFDIPFESEITQLLIAPITTAYIYFLYKNIQSTHAAASAEPSEEITSEQVAEITPEHVSEVVSESVEETVSENKAV